MKKHIDKHTQGLINLEKKLSHLTHTAKEVLYDKSDVDYRGLDIKTLYIIEHKSSGHRKKANEQLRTHQQYYVPKYIQEHPELEINRVKYFYSNPKGLELKFEEYL
jgi:hypothetical protein